MPACTSDHPVCSTEFIVYKPNNLKHKSFYYAAINAPEFTDYLLAHVTGSTGSRQRTQPKATLKYPMQAPSVEAIDEFCAFADPIYEQIKLNELESGELEVLRDTLLPKLISGEIDVSKVKLPKQLNNHFLLQLYKLEFSCIIQYPFPKQTLPNRSLLQPCDLGEKNG